MYQHGGHGVFVVGIQVAAAVVGDHDAGHLAVHPEM